MWDVRSLYLIKLCVATMNTGIVNGTEMIEHVLSIESVQPCSVRTFTTLPLQTNEIRFYKWHGRFWVLEKISLGNQQNVKMSGQLYHYFETWSLQFIETLYFIYLNVVFNYALGFRKFSVECKAVWRYKNWIQYERKPSWSNIISYPKMFLEELLKALPNQ